MCDTDVEEDDVRVIERVTVDVGTEGPVAEGEINAERETDIDDDELLDEVSETVNKEDLDKRALWE